MKINLYKIENPENYRNTLQSNEYELITSVTHNNIPFELWLLSKEHEPTNWKIILKNEFDLNNILDDEQKEKYKFDEGSNDLRALMIIEDSYVIPYGRGSFDIKDFIDPDFGLDFAEKALSPESIDKQTVDFFQQSKMRELTNYRSKNSSTISATESVSFISGTPHDINRYGSRIECGFLVNFIMPSNEYFVNLTELINNVTELMNNPDRPSYSLPRINRLSKKNPLNKDLFNRVFNKIISNNFEEIDNISLYENDGYFYNLSAFDTVKARIRENKQTLTELEDYSLNSIKNYIEERKEHHPDIRLEHINLIFSGDELTELKIPLIEVLYAFIIYNSQNYALQNGYWGEYNREYLRKLDETLNRIPTSIEVEPSRHNDPSEDTYIEDSTNETGDLISIHKKFVKPNNDYGGRKIGIEVGDMYNEANNEVHVVKKGGDTENSIYSIEQAILSIHVLRDLVNFDTTNLELEDQQLSNIKKITIKWLYFTDYGGMNSYYRNSDGSRKNQLIINSIHNHYNEEFVLTKNINSILLKNKIVEWYLTCIEYNFVSEINFETPIVNE